MGLTVPWNRVGVSLLALVVFVSMFTAGLLAPRHASAIAVKAQNSVTNVTNGGTSVSASFGSGATANNLLVAICGARGSVSLTGPSGFSTAINEAGSSSLPAQGIFYKVAAGGETAISCSSSGTARLGIQIYEYKGMVTASPLDATNTSASTGSSQNPASGSVTTTNANDLLIAGATTNANTSFSSWNNSFTIENSFANGGTTSSRATYSGADRIVAATGTYSSTATAGASGSWRGQIAAFKESSVALTADMVDGSGNSVASPSAAMTAANQSFTCQTVTGTLGISTQKMRVNNTTANAAWTLSMAATSGNTTKWTTGTNTYYFNSPTGSGCTNGQLTVNPSAGTLTPQSGCVNTNVSLGSSTAYSSGVTDSATIASATASAGVNCYWDITGVSLSQDIPGNQTAGSYSINMTLTITAN